MSNSPRAKNRRTKRSHLTKSQRERLTYQHFGDNFVYQGRPLRKGQNKKELMQSKS